MTVTTTLDRQYFPGDGSNLNFPFNFKFFNNSQIYVYLIDPSGNATGKTLNVDYTLSGALSPVGGTVVMSVAPAVGYQILVRRILAPEQPTSIRNQGAFFPAIHEDVFDRLTMLIQQNLADTARSLQLDVSGTNWDFEGMRGTNLGAPINDQDAATKKSTEDYVNSILATGQGPINNAANIFYTNTQGVPAILQGLVGNMIAGNITIAVPGQFSEPAAAMDWLRTKTIVNGAQVTIQLTASITPTRTTVLNHPQGDQISMLGSSSAPTSIKVIATSPLSFDGFLCYGGSRFGRMDNFVVDATAKSESPLNYTGILAVNGAFINCGPGMSVNNYYYSFAGRDNGVVFADLTKASNAGDVAYWAFNGGYVRARGATGTNVRDVANSLGFVFQAEYGGSVDCTGATATGGLVAGIAALSGGSVRAYNSITTGNDGDGYLARDNGVLVAHGGNSNSNGGFGISQITSGRVFGNGMSITGNTAGVNRPAAIFDNTNLGARIASTAGDLRIDTATGGFNTFFNSSGGLILSLLHIANAVNNAFIAGSSAGNPVRFGVGGTDTNIDLQLQTKGTGVVRFGSLTASADAAVSGYITIKDAGGTLRKLAVIN